MRDKQITEESFSFLSPTGNKPVNSYDIDDIVKVNLAGNGSVICEIIGIHIIKFKGILYDLKVYQNQIQFGLENTYSSGLTKGIPSEVDGFILRDIKDEYLEPYTIQYVGGKDINIVKKETKERLLKDIEYSINNYRINET